MCFMDKSFDWNELECKRGVETVKACLLLCGGNKPRCVIGDMDVCVFLDGNTLSKVQI